MTWPNVERRVGTYGFDAGISIPYGFKAQPKRLEVWGPFSSSSGDQSAQMTLPAYSWHLTGGPMTPMSASFYAPVGGNSSEYSLSAKTCDEYTNDINAQEIAGIDKHKWSKLRIRERSYT